MRFLFFTFLILISPFSLAAGNHPEAGACSPEKPYFAICTHSFHNLEGWYSSNCHASQEAAQRDADKHANEYHQGKSRWTGISKQRSTGYN